MSSLIRRGPMFSRGKVIRPKLHFYFIYIRLIHGKLLFLIPGVTLRRLRPSDSGVYVCGASSDVGNVFARAELYVQQRPVITVKPRYE